MMMMDVIGSSHKKLEEETKIPVYSPTLTTDQETTSFY
jgi:hypothetical protein